MKKELARQAAETAQVQKLAETKIAAAAPVERASAVMRLPEPAPVPLKVLSAGPAVQLAAFYR